MRNIFIIISMLLLVSCDHIEEDKVAAKDQLKVDSGNAEVNVEKSVTRMASNVRDSVKRTNNQMREWWLTPPPEPVKPNIPIRYCYKVLQDILCYRQQRPGWEDKLVGYQGDGAEPPKPATMEVMRLRDDNPDALPAARAANAKPVFAEMPADTKDTKDKGDTVAPVTVDSTHETLPESALSPQL